MQPFSALAPQIIAISESVPFTEKNKMPNQPYFLRRVFHFGVFFSSINIFLIYNIEFKSLSRFYYLNFVNSEIFNLKIFFILYFSQILQIKPIFFEYLNLLNPSNQRDN